MEKKEKSPRAISDATLDRYLCAILTLSERQVPVRSVDVAQSLGYSKACVCVTLKQLTLQQLVQVERQGALVLTDEGARRARAHRERWHYFQSLLAQSGVADPDADQEAQAITHALSARSFEALRRYLETRGVRASIEKTGSRDQATAL